MSPDIKTRNDAVSSYSKYKDELSSYSSGDNDIYMFGCDTFTNDLLRNAEGGASKICNLALNFLRHLKERNDSSYQKDGCKYLLYWLYVDVLNKETTIENTLIVYKALNKTFNVHNDGFNMFDNYINQMNKDTYDKVEKITNIYDVFNKYISQVTSEGPGKKCTSDCINLFTSYADECRKLDDKDFCNELILFRKQYNFFIQSVRMCEKEEYLLPPVETFDTVNVIILPFSLIFVTSLILLLLYKFTAFGPWISHLISKKKNIWDNINEETDQILNSYEMVEDNSKRNYNIAYNLS
ncbi:PIR Superfamily Protein [Plasmodium ovale wallikeri]|uniref:PIR Superfamily Protein n=1 Tax=Plasmodium ovale wallikeri TaxID=864142 RepID=A0A1A9AQI0_PLAOA|nr:PIR Superfamily Protein [Plasmodium ovale wallikeri]SBT58434.1 PIR Superfamily Protein [Plasmodium ovale wallikeri]